MLNKPRACRQTPGLAGTESSKEMIPGERPWGQAAKRGRLPPCFPAAPTSSPGRESPGPATPDDVRKPAASPFRAAGFRKNTNVPRRSVDSPCRGLQFAVPGRPGSHVSEGGSPSGSSSTLVSSRRGQSTQPSPGCLQLGCRKAPHGRPSGCLYAQAAGAGSRTFPLPTRCAAAEAGLRQG